jgi:all-trans-retinol 13,14-reductase
MFLSFLLLNTILGISYILYHVYLVKTKKSLPKNTSPIIVDYTEQISTYRRVSIDRDRFSKKKIPDNIHTIVIGSGIGGLSTAGFLAKSGKKVLVIEQHYIAGGCTHSFDEHGVEHETGIHYIGNIKNRIKVLNLITDKPVEWCQLGHEDPDTYIYDEIVIGDKKYDFRAGKENFIEDMNRWFPEEKEAIRKYIKLIQIVAKKDLFFMMKIIKNKWVRKIAQKCLNYIDKKYNFYVTASAYSVIRTMTDNEELIAVLCGQFGDYGPTPKNASFFIHASIVNHYLEGGYFPRGGTSVLAKQIIPTIEKSGGRVLVGKKVAKVIVERHNGVPHAVGVEMENGIKIYAENIVSGVGIRNTYNQEYGLLKEAQWSDKYQDIIQKIKPSVCHIYLFVNLKGTPSELKLRSSNIWVWTEQDYDAMMYKFNKDPFSAPMPFFMGFSCAKDDSWETRFPGKSNAIILTMGSYEMFEQWKDEKCTSRNPQYKELKEKFAQRILEEGLFRFYPHLRDKVESYDVGTPLSTQFYLNAARGESYGLESNTYRYLKAFHLRPETNLKNFYLTGQDVCTLGFTGALMSGILTAHSMLGYGTLMDLITKRNLVDDFINYHSQISNL